MPPRRSRPPAWSSLIVAPRPASTRTRYGPASTRLLGPKRSGAGRGFPVPSRVIRKSESPTPGRTAAPSVPGFGGAVRAVATPVQSASAISGAVSAARAVIVRRASFGPAPLPISGLPRRARRSPGSNDDAIERSLKPQAVARRAARPAESAPAPRPAALASLVDVIQEPLAARPDGRRRGNLDHHLVEGPLEAEPDVGRRLAETQAQIVERSVDRDRRYGARGNVQPRRGEHEVEVERDRQGRRHPELAAGARAARQEEEGPVGPRVGDPHAAGRGVLRDPHGTAAGFRPATLDEDALRQAPR